MRRLFLLVSAVVLVDTMFFAAVAPLLPHYAHELGLSKTGAGVLTAAYPAGTFAGSLPGGWLAARWGVKPTLLTGLSLLSVSRGSFTQGWLRLLRGLFGWGMYLAPLGMAALGVWLLRRYAAEDPQERWEKPVGAFLLFLVLLAFSRLPYAMD